MKKILCLCIALFSTQISSQEIKGLDSPATKLDILISSLYSQIGCKAKFSVWPVESHSKLEPELCINEIDYLLNSKTIRMTFVISENHHLVNGFDELEEKDRLVTISNIAGRVEVKTKAIIQRTSLLIGTYPINMEFLVAHKGYQALRNNKGEILSLIHI